MVRGVQLCHEDPARRPLNRSLRDREIVGAAWPGRRLPGHINAASRVHRDAGAQIGVASAKIGGENQRRTVRTQLRNEN